MFNWPGADQTGAAFVVEQKYRDAIELAASVQEIAYDLLTEGRFLPVTGTPASSYGEDGQWAINATTLEVWAKALGSLDAERDLDRVRLAQGGGRSQRRRRR